MMPPANVTTFCKADNGYNLLIYSQNQYKIAEGFHYLCTVFSFLILATVPLYLFGRLKWFGNMLFLSLQFQFFNLAILDVFTPMLAGLSYLKYIMGYN